MLRPRVPRKRVELAVLKVLRSCGSSLSKSPTETLPVSKTSCPVTTEIGLADSRLGWRMREPVTTIEPDVWTSSQTPLLSVSGQFSTTLSSAGTSCANAGVAMPMAATVAKAAEYSEVEPLSAALPKNFTVSVPLHQRPGVAGQCHVFGYVLVLPRRVGRPLVRYRSGPPGRFGTDAAP